MTPNNIAGMAMLGGFEVIALTDHNTSKNCPAFFEACRKVGIVPIAGMELTTAEEIHLVCLFPTLEGAMEFSDYVDQNRMKIPNRPDIFGEQLVMNGDDEVIGREESLLIPATDLDVFTAAKEVRARGGAAYPAHIDKQSNGIIAILGDIPKEAGFTTAEVKDPDKIAELKERFPILRGMLIVSDSDAHCLENMGFDPPSLDGVTLSEDENFTRNTIISRLRGEI